MLVNNNSNNQNKAVAYVRVSSQRQVEEGVSIAAQTKRIKEYASFKGISLANEDILVERGVSGGIPLWERPMGGKLKRMLGSGKYEHVITMKLDRMFRLVSDMLATVDELNAAGFALHMVDFNGEAIDTSSAMGRFFLTMSAAMAEMERGLISERTKMGMDQLKATHRKFTQSIYGWDVDPSGNLIPNWVEQNYIDFMKWQMDVNGLSAAAVARALNIQGLMRKRGGKWQGSTIVRVTGNPFHEDRALFAILLIGESNLGIVDKGRLNEWSTSPWGYGHRAYHPLRRCS
jgi:DNA invertase Pin-like site-specific DNA recombinase